MKNSIHTRFTARAALAVCAIGALLAGCMNGNTATDESEGSAPTRPGQISLVSINGLAKSAVTATGSTIITLDTARTSFQQYFILQNTGDEPVTDIELTTDNPNFTFSPSRIAVLNPSASASVLQVIKLNIVHGKKLEALGYGGFLTPGTNTVEAVISGVTFDDGDTVEVEEDVTLSTYAKLARIGVITQGTSRELPSLPNGYTGLGNNWGLTPHYYAPIDSVTNPDNTISLKNTGNVPLLVRRWETTGSRDSLPTFVLDVDSSFSFTSVILELDAQGVTFAPAGMPLSDAGTARFLLYGDRKP
jgi:hypothetical protein